MNSWRWCWGEGLVVSEGEVTPGATGVTVDVEKLVAIAPIGTADVGALIVLPNTQTLTLPGNATAGDIVYIIQVGYREVDGSTERRSFVNPVDDSVSAISTKTETIPSPELTYALALGTGYVALAAVTVRASNTGSPPGASDIVDLRRFRTDGLRDLYQQRTASVNLTDVPAPNPSGGGTVWLEISDFSTVGPPYTIVDNSIDWRDRYVRWEAWYYRGSTQLMPGESDDNMLAAGTGVNVSATLHPYVMCVDDLVEPGTKYASGICYTSTVAQIVAREQIMAGVWVDQWSLLINLGSGDLRFEEWVGVDVFCVIKLDYSPKQRHYLNI